MKPWPRRPDADWRNWPPTSASHLGDGTLGWPEDAPYDAILVAAGGREAPDALRQQLKVGGRLVMPIGERTGEQHLVRLTRTAADSFVEDDLGSVMFVPLIGQQGWAEEPASRAKARSFFRPRSAVPELIGRVAEPFDDVDAPIFGDLFDRFAGAQVVLLGEASHGTSEFYRARASDHPPAGGATRVHDRRGRGRLAGCRAV